MATKKQKREAGQRRHEEFLKKERERGLEAQRQDQERRRREGEDFLTAAQEVNAKYERILAAARAGMNMDAIKKLEGN